MEGLIGIDNSWLRGYYSNPSTIDININGVYNTDSGVVGTWPEGAYKYGVLIVACSKSFGGVQFYIPHSANHFYFRTSYNIGQSWGNWNKTSTN